MIWLIEVQHCDYDEHDAVVVRAPDEESALKEARDAFTAYQWKKYTATRITEEGETATILSSFNAG